MVGYVGVYFITEIKVKFSKQDKKRVINTNLIP